MPHYKLTYFDMDGGRAEPIRIAFHAAGIAFDDERFPFTDFPEVRKRTRFNAVPVLEIDGEQLTQTNAIARYVGKLGGLYPSDDLQALYCDEVMDVLEDVSHKVVVTFGLEGEALKEARQKLVDGWLTIFLRGIGQLLERGGDYFADDRLTIADLKAFVQVRSLRSGRLDHVPADLVDRLAPNLVAHQERVAADKRVVAWYETRKRPAA